jgi:hypothetical protein
MGRQFVFKQTVKGGNKLARDLKNEFEVNDMGEPNMIIGAKINKHWES